MTRPCSCLPGTPGSTTVLDPHCPVHGKDAAPAWAKVVAYIIVASGGEACEFHREGEHWLRGCDGGHEAPPDGLNREQRRRQAKAKRLR